MSEPTTPHPVDQLLDRALAALAAGDRATANRLAGEVLAVDSKNADAEDLLTIPPGTGEMRRLTILFADLVDSTALSTRIEPEMYRVVVGRYRDDVLRIIGQYGGHLDSTKGDGLLAYFGHPEAHEDDVKRAVQAGLDITRAVAALSQRVRRQFGFDIAVRVGVHRGIVYLDTKQSDVFGLAANLTARICALAEPDSVAVSFAIEPLIRSAFELAGRPPQYVKGVDEPVRFSLVVGEQDVTRTEFGPLIGRQREYAYLEGCWAQAVSAELQTPGVLLVGDAGIGKSRLAWAAVDMAERSNATVLELVGSPFHTDVGLRPIRRLLERRCRIIRTSDPAERLRFLHDEISAQSLDPARIVPSLAPVLSITPESGYQPVPAEGRKLYDHIAGAVHDYLLACVRGGPALILVEDMHWFDPSTVEVVQSLLDEKLSGEVMIVMTSRQLTTLPDRTHATTFELTPLTDDESDRLIAALDPDATPDEHRAVRHRCDGVPLYIEEVVAKLKSRRSNDGTSTEVPDTLYEALFARLRATENAVPVVEVAALIGGRIERHLLHSVVDLPAHDVDRVIEQLVRARVLEPLEEGNWRFRHELLREVGAELSPPTVRRRLHARIADVLLSGAEDGNPDWPLIARHYERAERYAEAASAYGQASADARQRGALVEALTHLTHAVAQAEMSPPGAGRDRLEVSLRLGRAFLAQAAEGVFSPNAAADFERCLALCSSDLQDDDLFSTVMSLYPYYTMRADLDRADRLVQSIRTSLTGPREKFIPINEFGLGMIAWYRGEFGYARDKLDIAAATLSNAAARELDALLFMPNDVTAGLSTHRALSRCVDGDLAGAEAELDRTAEYCEQLPFPKGAFSLAYMRQIEVMIRIEAGQLDRAAAVATQLGTLGEQHGFDSWALVGAAQSATVDALVSLVGYAGDPTLLAPHIAALSAILDTWRAVGVMALITFYDAILARLLSAAGQSADADARLRLGLGLANRTGMRFYDAELLRLRAGTTDDHGRCRAYLASALDLARRQDARIFELRTATDYFERFGEDGRQLLVGALAMFPADGNWPDVSRARALLE